MVLRQIWGVKNRPHVLRMGKNKGSMMSGTVYTVSNTSELYEALDKVSAGDVVELAPGDYGDVDILNLSFSSEVVLTSADKDNPAVFNSINASNISNVTFDGLMFDFVPDENTLEWDSALKVTNSSQITVRNSTFEGGDAVAGIPSDSEPGSQGASGIMGEPIGRGMTIGWSSDIIIENNDVSHFTKGIVLNDVADLTVSQNEIHDLRSSPLTGSVNSNIIIEENYFHDFYPWSLGGQGDHGDYVHLWTVADQDVPVSDITIRNNFFSEGDGESLLGIYLDDNTNDVGFENVLIEGNLIHLGDSQAIRLEDVNGGEVVRNSLLQSSGEANDAPGIGLHDSSNLTISDNIMSSDISGISAEDMAAAGISESNNLIVQYDDPQGENYFGDMFVNSSIPGAPLSGLRAIPGSAADGVGSPLTQVPVSFNGLTPSFQITSAEENSEAVIFDATYTFDSEGQITSKDATFQWDFGDGTTGTGQIVQHSYDEPGVYDVKLRVVQDGEAAIATAETGIAGDDVLAFSPSNGSFYVQAYGENVALEDSKNVSVFTGDNKALDLGGSGTVMEIPKEALARFFGTEAFEMSMTLQADQPGESWGEVARIHGSIIVSVQGDGDLNVRMFPDSGELIDLTTTGVAINDGVSHDISIRFDGTSDSLQILVDGSVAASETVDGAMPEMGSWGLVFGEPWGGQNFDGKLSAFDLNATSTEYPVFEGTLETEPAPGNSLPVLDDHVTDFSELKSFQFRDDTYVEAGADGDTVYMDGDGDQVQLGRLREFEDTDQLSFSVDFAQNTVSDQEQRLVWNYDNIGLAVEGDGLKVYVGQEDASFKKAISIDNLGLDDTEEHQVIVMADAGSDRLQVVLDGVLVLDSQNDLEIAFVENKADQAGWKLSTRGDLGFDGEVSDFRIEGDVDFLADFQQAPDDVSLMA